MMFMGILAMLVAGACLTRRGSLEALAATEFRHVTLLVEGMVIQLAFVVWSPPGLTQSHALAVVVLSNVATAAFLVLNRRLPGLALVGVGLALNMTAICANGAMPVSPTAAQAIDLTPPPAGTALKHERLDENTRLPWLGDVIPIPGIREVLSIGDLVLALGIAKLIYVRMMSNRRSEPATTGEASG